MVVVLVVVVVLGISIDLLVDLNFLEVNMWGEFGIGLVV